MEGHSEAVSPELARALRTFRHFLESDDRARANQIESSERQQLSALADALEPLNDEINEVLDRLVARPHPLSEYEGGLEEDLNSLAQAGMEARMELANRSA